MRAVELVNVYRRSLQPAKTLVSPLDDVLCVTCLDFILPVGRNFRRDQEIVPVTHRTPQHFLASPSGILL